MHGRKVASRASNRVLWRILTTCFFFISIPLLSIVRLLFFKKAKHNLAYLFSKVKHTLPKHSYPTFLKNMLILPKFPPAASIFAILDTKLQKNFACGGQFLYSIFSRFLWPNWSVKIKFLLYRKKLREFSTFASPKKVKHTLSILA